MNSIKVNKRTGNKIFLLSVLFIIFASSMARGQGPKEPNIAGFEPVDASDMVNLSSGDMTYVLPLLSVPSPEGGYPVALSYHAGVPLDQEASWVGLGWNFSPGAINRGINGYPDDWRAGKVEEIFKDVGFQETYQTFSVNYISWDLTSSIGLNITHSSNKGIGGFVSYSNIYGGGVSLGVEPGGKVQADISAMGLSVGTSGIGIQVGYKGFNVGIKQSFNGQGATFSGGYGGSTNDKNGVGFAAIGFGYNTKNGLQAGASIGIGKLASLGVSFDNGGISSGMSIAGLGVNFQVSGGIDGGDYTVVQTEDKFGIIVPVPTVGIFSLGYSKQKVHVFLSKTEIDEINGSLYFQNATGYTPNGCYIYCLFADGFTQVGRPCSEGCQPGETYNGGYTVDSVNSYMDIYEVGIDNQLELDGNNLSLPAYDNFSVTSQGLSGIFTPKRFKTAHLMGLKKEFDNSGNPYTLDYNLAESLPANVENITSFGDETYFTFDNEYSTSLLVNPVSLKTGNLGELHNYLDTANSQYVSEQRKSGGNFIETFSNDDLVVTSNRVGLMMPATDVDRPFHAGEGIGAYRITTPDGKVYHYTLPVYTRDIVSRTIGTIDNKPENQSYFEKQQLKPYATHWLLTAVTGPDYVKSDTGREYPDEGDLGYWVRFDYGRWSDAAVWKSPIYEDYNVSEENANIKSVTYGTRQIYYLDKIKTRTHTALFIKNIRTDARTPEWDRKEFRYNGPPNTSHYNNDNPFIAPSQYLLKLDKIILVKNGDDNTNNGSGNILGGGSFDIKFNPNGPRSNEYHMDHNILDVSDNLDDVLEKSIEIVDLGAHQDYSLVSNAPFSDAGRLTLNGISFLGKDGASVMPAYEFNYDNSKSFDWNKKDLWGYHSEKPEVWSMNEIISPIGAKIKINYESDQFKPVINLTTDGEIIPDAFGVYTGGGLRVASVETTDGINSLKTLYNYKDPNTNRSSGVISYVPFLEDAPNDMPYGSQLPAPIPYYEYVTVHSIANGNPNDYNSKTRFKFRVLEGFSESGNAVSLGDFFRIDRTVKQNSTYSNKKVSVNEFYLENNFNTLGQLLETETFNKFDVLVSKTINEYADKNDIDQGITQESYQSYERVNYENSGVKDQWNINTTTVKKYPSVLKSSTSYQGGLVNVTYYDNHDPITGQLLETRTIDSKGNEYISKSIPAYTIPQYSGDSGGYGMGSKLNDITNKNLLAQQAASFSFLKKNDGTLKVLGASISTWNNDWSYRNIGGGISSPTNDMEKIWRKHSSVVWKGALLPDGSYSNYSGDFDGFNWSLNASSQPESWRKVSETTLYDHYSLPLEQKDINGNRASTKTVDNDTKVGLVGNAGYTEMFASGAEYLETYNGANYVAQEVKIQSSYQDGSKYHTGKYSLRTPSGGKAFWTTLAANQHRTGKYKISVWVDKSNYSRARINVGSGNISFNGERVFAGDWIQLNHYVDITSSSSKSIYLTSSSGNVYYDDYRLHPVQSSISTYVYNDLDELTYKLGSNNMGIHYIYDGGSSLIETYVEVANSPTVSGGFKLASTNKLKYAKALAEDDTGTDGGDQDDLLVYFDDYVQQSGSAASTAKLKGPPGTKVRLQAFVSGPLGDSISAFLSTSGGSACVPTTGGCDIQTDITIPSSGSINISIKFNYQSVPNTTLDCAGIAEARIVTIVQGPGTVDTSRRIISDQDNSCN